MRKSKTYTENEVITKTRVCVRNFYSRQMDKMTEQMTDDFVWIGACEFQWAESLQEFERVTEAEQKEPPVHLSQEEFHVLVHEKGTWVVYGRYTADVLLDNGTLLHAKIRGTYVWKQFGDELKMLHIHGSHAQDVPMQHPAPTRPPFQGETGFFEYLKGIDYQASESTKMCFRDRTNSYHFLLPSEIVYVQAERQWCQIFTREDNFAVRGGISEYEKRLPGYFLRTHKSYLVNSRHINVVRRYASILHDGTELPIGKERYMDIKQQLQQLQ